MQWISIYTSPVAEFADTFVFSNFILGSTVHQGQWIGLLHHQDSSRLGCYTISLGR